MMRLPSLTCLLAIAVIACERTPPPPPVVDGPPPDGSAHYLDADGIARTLLSPFQTLSYGDRVGGELPPPAALTGYEFSGSAGDTPRLILDVRGAARVSLALYGRRDDTGLWGRPLAVVDGADVLRLSPDALSADGYYFVLVRRLGGEAANYELELTCEGCAEPICPAVEPCDLYCEQGYAAGDDGCRACACEENPCAEDGDCLANEVCREGLCRPAPTCAEMCPREQNPVCTATGRTLPNACVAACEGFDAVEPGACPDAGCGPDRPCGDGQQCVGGRCICDCGDEVAPVCAASNRTYSNACQLLCQGEVLAYEGPCDDTPDAACDGDGDCRQGLICARGLDGPGVCTDPCRPNDPRSCGQMSICSPQADGRGACLPLCRPGAACADPLLSCLPDRRGASICTPCDCPDDDPVCIGGRLDYPSACAARCAGFDDTRLEPGACVDAPAEIDCARCPAVWAPVCGDGLLRATRCDAECGERPAVALEPAEACYRNPPVLACAVDADCMRTGAVGSVCASAPSDASPPLSPDARCFAGLAVCGCIEGMCGFRPDRRVAACLEQARGREPPPPPP